MNCNIIISNWKHNPALICIGIALSSVGILGTTPAFAQESTVEQASASAQLLQFNLSAGPLEASLNEISQISGTKIVFMRSEIENISAPKIVGSFTPMQAIQMAIGYGNMQMEQLEDGTISIQPNETIVIYGSRNEAEKSFLVGESETATRFGEDLQILPQSITVISARVIESLQAQSIQDSLQLVGGIVTRAGAQGTPNFQIRGFSQSGTMINGVSNPAAANTNINGVERIEILKGPQSILSGSQSLGGSINIVSKKPTAERIRDLSVTAASNDYFNAAIDVSDGLTDGGKLSGRVIASKAKAQDNDAGYDRGQESDFAQVGLRWNDDDIDFVVTAKYDKAFIPKSRYTFGLDGIQEAPSMQMGIPESGIENKTNSISSNLEYDINSWLSLVSRVQYSKTDTDLQLTTVQFPAAPPTVFGMVTSSSIDENKSLSGDHYFRIYLETGDVEHKMTAGFNHTGYEYTLTSYDDGNFNILDLYADEQFEFSPIPRNDDTLFAVTNGQSKQSAFYFQDFISYNQFHVALGIRKDTFEQGAGNTRNYQFDSFTETPDLEVDKTTFNGGLVYEVNDNLSVYGSYSEGFNPQFTSTTICGNTTSEGLSAVPPMETTNKELGVKTSSDDDRFSLTTSVYELQQKNYLNYDPSGNCLIVREANKVQGAEIEAIGKPIDSLSLIFSYTYTDIEDLGDPEYRAGAQPEHLASLWANYDLQSEDLYGFGFGAGLTTMSSSLMGFSETSQTVPGGSRLDLSAYYEALGWSLRINVNNVLDKQLYGVASSTLFVPILPERNFSVTLKHSF